MTIDDCFSNLKCSISFLRLERQENWLKFDHLKLTTREALEKLNDLIDESDPDTSLPK